ncbi:MAG: 2-oxoglutarate and iron-dependent oxygenase domain-containing protein [Gammaproteobacteria bacterium]|nr:2-oxoglutarate and iron-dependent oxygenase domain-containing protein [Gammaproteobacteria bacterium]
MLATIDLAEFVDGDNASRQAIAESIGAACEHIGFMYVGNHGVDAAIIEDALGATREFFAEPMERKQALERRSGTYRGYIPMTAFSEDRDSGRDYLYEAFIVGAELEPSDCDPLRMRWPNVWPSEGTVLREAVSRYYESVTRVAEHLLRAFARALGRPEETLLALFDRPMTNLSLLHYPPGDAGDGRANARPHYDTNALTVLLPSDVGGLEVEHRTRGWVEVAPRPGCFVVNIGNMMECWSGGRFRSTMHRVHPPAGHERHSIAYFATPGYDTLVEPLPEVALCEGFSRPQLHAGRAFAAFVAQFDRIPAQARAAARPAAGM